MNVPEDPTEEMVIAGFECEAFDALCDAANAHRGWPYSCKQAAELVRAIYRAMIARAPTPEPETTMNEARAREILGGWIDKSDSGLFCLGYYIAWTPGEEKATLDDEFSAEELEAIAWWMRHKPSSPELVRCPDCEMFGGDHDVECVRR